MNLAINNVEVGQWRKCILLGYYKIVEEVSKGKFKILLRYSSGINDSHAFDCIGLENDTLLTKLDVDMLGLEDLI